ncbi:hypothetical protein DFH09DRAFT_1396596 [Mycena vulgaris]|nr:hypothetical protein DFH09DRAFT_1396596 [Mycena vulgaris]
MAGLSGQTSHHETVIPRVSCPFSGALAGGSGTGNGGGGGEGERDGASAPPQNQRERKEGRVMKEKGKEGKRKEGRKQMREKRKGRGRETQRKEKGRKEESHEKRKGEREKERQDEDERKDEKSKGDGNEREIEDASEPLSPKHKRGGVERSLGVRGLRPPLRGRARARGRGAARVRVEIEVEIAPLRAHVRGVMVSTGGRRLIEFVPFVGAAAVGDEGSSSGGDCALAIVKGARTPTLTIFLFAARAGSQYAGGGGGSTHPSFARTMPANLSLRVWWSTATGAGRGGASRREDSFGMTKRRTVDSASRMMYKAKTLILTLFTDKRFHYAFNNRALELEI